MENLNQEEKEFLGEVGMKTGYDLKENENEILSYIMSKSTKNGDKQKEFNTYNNILRKI